MFFTYFLIPSDACLARVALLHNGLAGVQSAA